MALLPEAWRLWDYLPNIYEALTDRMEQKKKQPEVEDLKKKLLLLL